VNDLKILQATSCLTHPTNLHSHGLILNFIFPVELYNDQMEF